MHVQICKEKKVIRRYTEGLSLNTDAHKVHWEDNTSFIYVFNLEELLLKLNTLIFLSVFYKRNLTMVSLFQNMRSPVS